MTHGDGESGYSRFPITFGRLRMKRLLFMISLLLFMVTNSLSAFDVGITIGTFDGLQHNALTDEGTHVQLGTVVEISPRWDLEAFVVTQATPRPFMDVAVGTAVSFALMGPVYEHRVVKEVPPFGNMYASLGFLGNVGGDDAYGPFIRLTPISVGGPQFLLRERGASVGVFYNIPGEKVTVFWNIFLLDFYL